MICLVLCLLKFTMVNFWSEKIKIITKFTILCKYIHIYIHRYFFKKHGLLQFQILSASVTCFVHWSSKGFTFSIKMDLSNGWCYFSNRKSCSAPRSRKCTPRPWEVKVFFRNVLLLFFSTKNTSLCCHWTYCGFCISMTAGKPVLCDVAKGAITPARSLTNPQLGCLGLWHCCSSCSFQTCTKSDREGGF